MWPEHWTSEECEALKRRDPIAFRTDVLGEFADAESSLFGAWELESLCRRAPAEIQPSEHLDFVAAIDPAAQADAFSLVVVTRVPDERWGDVLSVALARSWEPPLSPDEVLGRIATILRPYRVTTVHTDQWSAAALKDLARQHGLALEVTTITQPIKVDMFESLKTLVADRRIVLAPNDELLEDLRRVRKKLMATGVRIEFPRVGGRHCDMASAMALACAQSVEAPELTLRETYGQTRKRELIRQMRRAQVED
jgi:phage FluMu gp28-like protein